MAVASSNQRQSVALPREACGFQVAGNTCGTGQPAQPRYMFKQRSVCTSMHVSNVCEYTCPCVMHVSYVVRVHVLCAFLIVC